MAIDLSARKAEHTARLMVPQALLFLFLLLSVASLPLPHANEVKNQLVLMAIFYWAIYRPTLVPPFFCFFLGLAMDVLGGFPLGLNACILVLLQWLVRDQRKSLVGQPFFVIWAVFGLVALSAALMQWGLIGLQNMSWAKPMPVVAGTVISLFLFPFITMLLVFTHRLLPVPPRTYS